MSPLKLKDAIRLGLMALLVLAAVCAQAQAAGQKVRVQAGHAEVVISPEEVKTVAIAEPNIADAAVGSARSVVVNGKAPGTTTLVVYNEGGRFTMYDVEVYVPPTAAPKQVILHVRVAEANATAVKELGLDAITHITNSVPWLDGTVEGGLFTTKVQTPSLPLSVGTTTDGAVAYERNDGRFGLQATWRALEQKGDIRTLASPTLVARSGEKASFLSGGEFPVPVAQSGAAAAATSGGTLVSASAVTIEWKEFGVKVEFTPTVLDDGTISLKVAPEVSALDFTNPLELSGFRVPIINSRKASTSVNVQSGEHLVIGGLKQTLKTRTVKRVPLLGQLPILGVLFRSTRTESNDSDLLIVVSPEILDSALNALPPLPSDRPERK
jgi:pilus assembly protein CpaC